MKSLSQQKLRGRLMPKKDAREPCCLKLEELLRVAHDNPCACISQLLDRFSELQNGESLRDRLSLRPYEAASTLGVGLTTIYHLVSTGRLRIHRYGRISLIARADLERLLAEGG